MAGVVAGEDPTEPEPEQEPSVEAVFAGQPVPPWWRQVTARSVAVSVVLGTLFSFVSMRVGLTVGIVPSFNMSASLVSFFIISSWTRLMARCGVACQPFTRQENVVVQTCIISCAMLSLYGGFTTYLPAMTETVAKSAGGTGTGRGVYELHPMKIMAFLFLVSFSSLFCTLPLRKMMILDYKLLYPSGSAIAGIVNSFHTPKGAKTAKLQMLALSKCVAGSFMWACFQWLYTAGDGCGFQSFPLFGLEAYSKRLYFDFSASLVGVGMICPCLINFSTLFGAVTTSWIIWPMIESKKGEWYTDASPISFRGINGYKVPMGVALVLGDCLFQLGVISTKAAHYFYIERREKKPVPKAIPDGGDSDEHSPQSYDDHRRNQSFQNDGLPANFAVLSYIILAIISIFFVPRIFPQIRYYHVAFGYAIAPLLAFCNSYASGLTDWSLGTVYGKLAIFIVGAWVGEASGGAIAGLVACGVMLVIIGNAAELMQDFKSGYLTLTSPLSMFISQAIGTALGCLINPFVFLSFQKLVGKEHLGEAGTTYAAPMAVAYRAMAVVSVEGVDTLPKHCIQLCGACFLAGLCLHCLAAVARSKNWRVNGYIPNPMAMSIPFFLGPTLSIDLCVGSLILIIWRRADKKGAAMFGLVAASGLICGDGLWAFPSSVLSILKVQPPICMKYLSSYQSEQVDQHFLPNLDTSSC